MDLIVVTTGPNSDPDNIIARIVEPSEQEPADKNIEANPTRIIRSEDSAMAETDDGHNIPPDVIKPGEAEMTPPEAGGVLHRPSQDPHRLSGE